MPNTHYLALVGDSHIRGIRPAPLTVDRRRGRYLRVAKPDPDPAPISPVPNTIIRGATSGTVVRIVQVLSPTEFIVEQFVNPNVPFPFSLLSLSGTAFAANVNMGAFPVSGETLTFSNGGVAYVDSGGDAQVLPYSGQFLEQLQDNDLVAVPSDYSDQPWWDRGAQVSRLLTAPTASLTGPAPHFRPGDACTTPSGTFTVQLATVIGSDLQLRVFSVTGTITSGQVVTNVTLGSGAGCTLNSVSAARPRGIFVPWDPIPNLDGNGTYFEHPPLGNGTDRTQGPGIGPEQKLLSQFHSYWGKQAAPSDRAVRMVAHSSNDDFPTFGDGILGGVVIQVVRCTGTFSSAWQVGEVVNGGGGWSARVHGFNPTLKLLFVRQTNGATLTAGTVTGATSGATGTSEGSALGWQKGSRHWNNWIAQCTAASTSPASEFTNGGTFSGSAPKWEALCSMIWECELAVFSTSIAGATWPSNDEAIAEWVRWAADARTTLGNPDMRIVQWMHRYESQSAAVYFIPPGILAEFPNGIPGTFRVKDWMSKLPAAIENFTIIDSETQGYEMAVQRATSPLPPPGAESDSTLWLRPLDYYQLGDAFFRHWQGGQVSIVPGDGFKQLPIGILIGQSNATGFINAGLAVGFDNDPDLYPHNSFAPGVNTVDSNALSYNFQTGTLQPYDIQTNGNGSFGTLPGTCGSDPPLVQRFKMRYSSDPEESVPFGLFKCTVPGSALQPNAIDATACWDPELATRSAIIATCAVTTFAATVSTPARGRFTATPGTFSSLVWQVQMSTTIEGSALGNVGGGGNNTIPFAVVRVYAIDPAGAWIEFDGAFTAEASRPFTFTAGPPPIWPYFVFHWRKMISQCHALGYVPRPVFCINIQGESDLAYIDGYQAALTRLWNAIDAECGRRLKGETPMAKVQVLTHSKTGWPVDDSIIAQQRTIQAAVMAALPNSGTIDVSDLALELRQQIWPRIVRTDNGVHLTGRAYITQGFRLDAKLATLAGIPPHPNGELGVDFGSVDGGVALAGTDSGTDGGVESFGAQDGPGVPGVDGLIVEDGTGLDNADSFASVAFFRAFWLKNGGSGAITTATDEQVASALRRATREWTEGVCGSMWRGNVQYQSQRLSFPRVGCYDDEGRLVPMNTVPWQIPDATCIVAGDFLQGGTLLTSSVELGPILRETKRGLGFEKTVEYGDGGKAAMQSIRRIRAAEALVYPLIRGQSVGVTRS